MKNKILLPLVALTLASCHSKPDYDATGIFEATTVTVSAETSGKILALDLTEATVLSAANVSEWWIPPC